MSEEASLSLEDHHTITVARELSAALGYPLRDRYGYAASDEDVLFVVNAVRAHPRDEDAAETIGIGNVTGDCELAEDYDIPASDEFILAVATLLRPLIESRRDAHVRSERVSVDKAALERLLNAGDVVRVGLRKVLLDDEWVDYGRVSDEYDVARAAVIEAMESEGGPASPLLTREEAAILTADRAWSKKAQCGPCSGHSPRWDGHNRDCPQRIIELVAARLREGSS